MAMFKKDNKLPDLPSPPSKFSDISKPDFDNDFPRYTSTINMEESHMEEKPRVSQMPTPDFPRENIDHFEKRPLFIKIERYENAISTLNSIKEKLDAAGNIVSELRQIRRDEDAQLDEWSENIRGIKEKLMNVDTILFE